MKYLTSEWLSAADKDIKAASRLLNDEALTSVVTFHCQQAIEKLFKAILVDRDLEPQRIHDLLRLYKLVSEYIDPIEDISTLKVINEAYIDSRYPGEMGLLPNGEPSLREATIFCEFTKSLFDSIKCRLKT